MAPCVQTAGMIEPVRKSVALGGGAMSVLEWAGANDEKRPLLHFAHANGFNAETYRALLSPLAARFHVVAGDARGHGFSTLPATIGMQAGWRIFRDDLLALLETLDAGPAILAGHSMGATASLMAAALRPERVRALVLVEPVLYPRLAPLMMRVARLLGRTSDMPDLVAMAEKRRAVFPSFEMALKAYTGRGAFKTWPGEMVRDYLTGGLVPTGNGEEVRLACDPRWEAEDFRQPPPGISRLAPRVRCPVTLLHGTRPGSTARPHEVRRFARMGARIVTVAEAGHFLPMEFPEVVREEILRIS